MKKNIRVFTSIALFIITIFQAEHTRAGRDARESSANIPEPGQRFALVLSTGDLALDITTNAVGRDLQCYRFHGRIGQRFHLKPTVTPGAYRIVAEISGLSLDEGKDGMVIVSRETVKASQRWRFVAAKDGGVHIVNAASGRAITCVDNWRGLLRDIDQKLPQAFRFQPIVTGAFQPQRARSEYARIPIIDVHTHIRKLETAADYIAIGEILEKNFNTRIDIWIEMDGHFGTGWNESFPAESRKLYGERIRYVLYTGYQDLLAFKPDDITLWATRGDVVGYKMWWGYQKGIDDPANDPSYARMARIGLPVASAHVTHPFFSKEYPEARWTETMDRWENVLKKHPKLVAVMAHMGSMLIDGPRMARLERMLKTYPNLHIDTCFGFTEYSLSDYNRIRSFIITHSDRILFGTDLMKENIKNGNHAELAAQYDRTFRVFETDEYVGGSTFLMGGDWWTYRGLKLPKGVLEKIYFKNALRIYPGLRNSLEKVRKDNR